jgi:hypothetical protein
MGVQNQTRCEWGGGTLQGQVVARGFTQTYGVDYNKTFAPVAKFTSIRCIIALAALEDMEIH